MRIDGGETEVVDRELVARDQDLDEAEARELADEAACSCGWRGDADSADDHDCRLQERDSAAGHRERCGENGVVVA